MWCGAVVLQGGRSGDVALREGNRRGVPTLRRETQTGKTLARKGRRGKGQDRPKNDPRNTGRVEKVRRRGGEKSAGRKKVSKKQYGGKRSAMKMVEHVTIEESRWGHGTRRQDLGRHGTLSTCWQAPSYESVRQEQCSPDSSVHSQPPPPVNTHPTPTPAPRAATRPHPTTGPRAQTENTKPQEPTKRKKAPATSPLIAPEARRGGGKAERKHTEDSSLGNVKLESDGRRGEGRKNGCRRKAKKGHPRRKKINSGRTEGNGKYPCNAQRSQRRGGVETEWIKQGEEVRVSKKDSGSGSSPPQLQGTRAAQSGKPLKGIRKQPGASSPAGGGPKKRVRL